jgi:macrodomain Ter protein organizer (MatP/YcbG family)
LEQVARTQGKDVAAFLLDSLRRQLRQDILSEPEANLLQIINAPVAPEARRQRDALLALRQQRELTASEQEMLTQLIDAVEIANAKRWQSLADLAERRGLSLSEIAGQLQIPLP